MIFQESYTQLRDTVLTEIASRTRALIQFIAALADTDDDRIMCVCSEAKKIYSKSQFAHWMKCAALKSV